MKTTIMLLSGAFLCAVIIGAGYVVSQNDDDQSPKQDNQSAAVTNTQTHTTTKNVVGSIGLGFDTEN